MSYTLSDYTTTTLKAIAANESNGVLAKLKPHVKNKWTKALLSGNYKQARSVLRTFPDEHPTTPYRHCCLGVMCDIAPKYLGYEWKDSNRSRYFGPVGMSVEDYIQKNNLTAVISAYQSETTPPIPIMRWAFQDQYNLDEIRASLNSLMHLNDAAKFTFQQIAEWVEDHL